MDENESPKPVVNGSTWAISPHVLLREPRLRGDVVVYAGIDPPEAGVSTVLIDASREHMRVAGGPSSGGWKSIVIQAHPDQWLNLVVYNIDNLVSVLLEAADEPPFLSAVGRMEVRIPDEPETVIGLDELVDAILIPNFDRNADWAYWRRFVDLTCAIFGLEGRTESLQLAIRENHASAVLPMDGHMEVPEEIAAGMRGIAHVDRRIEFIQGQMKELQREFFRGVLLAIDPTIEHRRTTVGRLRELGLGERTYPDWDNF